MSEEQTYDADPKTIHQMNFSRDLDCAGGVGVRGGEVVSFIIKEAILGLLQIAVKVL